MELKEATLGWVRRHATTIGLAFFVLGTTFTAGLFAFFASHSANQATRVAGAVLCVALMAFYMWAALR
jgi:hypothetical protein